VTQATYSSFRTTEGKHAPVLKNHAVKTCVRVETKICAFLTSSLHGGA